MNKLNKIFSVVVFVFFLLSTVFITTSYANADIFLEGDTYLTSEYWCGGTGTVLPNSTNVGINEDDIISITNNYYSNLVLDSSYIDSDFNNLISAFLNFYNENYNYSLDSYLYCGFNGDSRIWLFDSNDVDIIGSSGGVVNDGNVVINYSLLANSNFGYVTVQPNAGQYNRKIYYYNYTGTVENAFSSASNNGGVFSSYPFSSNLSIKLLTKYKFDYSSNKYIIGWDGTYYQYIENTPDYPVTPTFPTNAEIANAVQKFYNSDIYKNNKNFSDFFVVYYTHNRTFAFIGHTIGDDLGQVIVPPGVREQGKLYGEQWWHFFVDENAGAPPYGTTFYLYTTEDFGETFQNDGTGTINGLVNIDFSKSAVIVYSTTDYKVKTYVLDEETGDITYTDGVIEGDQYTYDEELNPTENYYNPLDNFVTVNPADTIVDGADFEFIKGKFEEFKDLFVFGDDMQWLISANNKLSNYFIGFIVMCAWFFAIGRILKG